MKTAEDLVNFFNSAGPLTFSDEIDTVLFRRDSLVKKRILKKQIGKILGINKTRCCSRIPRNYVQYLKSKRLVEYEAFPNGAGSIVISLGDAKLRLYRKIL